MYNQLVGYLSTLTSNDFATQFKNSPAVMGIFEHVSYQIGYEYLQLLKTKTSLSPYTIRRYCEKNDRIGGGVKYTYDDLTTSSSNFRYLFHAHLILSHLQHLEQTSTRMVEIGCGYGGLCLALDSLAPLYGITITAYYMIDLPEVSKLQQKYMFQHNVSFPVEFHLADTYGEKISASDDLFLISNYCISEIAKEHRDAYIRILLPKTPHGFFTWNFGPVEEFGYDCKQEDEYPLTGTWNKYIYF